MQTLDLLFHEKKYSHNVSWTQNYIKKCHKTPEGKIRKILVNQNCNKSIDITSSKL